MHTHPALLVPPRPDAHDVLRRVAMPFLLFSAVLASLLALSWALLLPGLTQVEVGGEARRAADVRTYASSLTAQIVENEAERWRLVLAVQDPHYLGLKRLRASRPSIERLRAEFRRLAAAVTDQADAVHLASFRYDPADHSLVLTGDVRSVGSRSMTVLAEFVETLRASPMVESLQTPQFAREDDPSIGLHSPFTLSLTLR